MYWETACSFITWTAQELKNFYTGERISCNSYWRTDSNQGCCRVSVQLGRVNDTLTSLSNICLVSIIILVETRSQCWRHRHCTVNKWNFPDWCGNTNFLRKFISTAWPFSITQQQVAWIVSIQGEKQVVGEMSQQLIKMSALPDEGSVPRTHMVSHGHL